MKKTLHATTNVTGIILPAYTFVLSSFQVKEIIMGKTTYKPASWQRILKGLGYFLSPTVTKGGKE